MILDLGEEGRFRPRDPESDDPLTTDATPYKTVTKKGRKLLTNKGLSRAATPHQPSGALDKFRTGDLEDTDDEDGNREGENTSVSNLAQFELSSAGATQPSIEGAVESVAATTLSTPGKKKRRRASTAPTHKQKAQKRVKVAGSEATSKMPEGGATAILDSIQLDAPTQAKGKRRASTTASTKQEGSTKATVDNMGDGSKAIEGVKGAIIDQAPLNFGLNGSAVATTGYVSTPTDGDSEQISYEPATRRRSSRESKPKLFPDMEPHGYPKQKRARRS